MPFWATVCGQTVVWIKMKLGMQVGLDAGHTVLDEDKALPPLAGWIRMPLGREVGLGQATLC